MITKHNDFEQIESLKAMSGEQLRAVVSAGLIQIGSFDTQDVAQQEDIVLSPDFTIGWSHPNEIRAKGFKVDYSKYKNKPRSYARLFSKSREGAYALRDGMVKYAENCGLTPDHAYNWSRIFDPARFALISALVELQNNEQLRNYIKTVPIITSNYTQFKNWLYSAPTDNPDFGVLDQRSIVSLSNISNKVLRGRLTPKECFEMRQDQLEAKARRTGQTFQRAEFKEHAPRADFKPRGDRKPYENKHASAESAPIKDTDSKLARFRDSVEKDAPRPVKEERRQTDRHTTILSCMPNHEERSRRKKQGGKKPSGQSRKEARWQ